MPDTIIETRLRVFQAWLVASVVVGLLGFILAVGFMLFTTLSIRSTAEENQAALCSLRHDLELRHDAGVQFLEDNPNGIPGISAAQIRQSLDNQESTLRALSGLSC